MPEGGTMSVGSVMVAGDERSDCYYCCWDMRNMKVMVDFDVGVRVQNQNLDTIADDLCC